METKTEKLPITKKKQIYVGTKELVDTETGEIYPVQLKQVEERDFNFTKVWLQMFINGLENIANKTDLDKTLHDLSLCWELSTQETYNDYTDFAPEIGWNLAIGYLKDNKRKQAKATLEKLIEVAPEGTAIGNKARELLNQI